MTGLGRRRAFVRIAAAAAWGLGLSLGLALGVGGCSADPSKGYSFESAIGGDAKSVCVPVFENSTFHKGLEVRLTQAVISELRRGTRLDVTGGELADTLLTGTIKNVELRQISRDSFTGMVDEQAVRITVDFSWRDSRTGRTIVSRQNFAAVDTFVAGRGTGERIDVGERATVQRLARDIVGELRSSW
jgi:hypothetical protein